jgi:hypothetical protein
VTLPLEERGQIIREYARRHGLRLFIETGSGDGCTARQLANDFDRVFTIEISAYKYFGVWGALLPFPHVLPIHGDSSIVLPHLLNQLDEPATFWLDAHYDGGDGGRGVVDTPICDELFFIFAAKRSRPNVILIDDARFFGTDPAYPTVSWIEGAVGEWCKGFGWPQHSVEVADDIIRIEVSGRG